MARALVYLGLAIAAPASSGEMAVEGVPTAAAIRPIALSADSVEAPLVTHHMGLDEAPDAYRAYDNREALKIVLSP